jgi:hypothetical protein
MHGRMQQSVRLSDAKQRANLIYEQKRKKDLEYTNKWDDFRVRRDKLFKRYIQVKHRRERMEALCHILNNFSVVKCLTQAYFAHIAFLAFKDRIVFRRNTIIKFYESSYRR